MKKFCEFVGSTFLAGLLIVVPLYLSVLLALKAMQSVVGWCVHSPGCSRNGFPLKISFLFFWY